MSRWYRVAAVDTADVRGTWSETATATTLPPQVDTTKVERLTATGGRGRIDLSWRRPPGSQRLREYKIQVATSSGGSFSDLATTTGTRTTYAHSGLGDGVSRWYRVAAVDTADMRGTWSETATATTLPQTSVPSVARSVIATVTGSHIVLTWVKPTNEGSSALTGYRIETSPNGSSGWSRLAQVGPTVAAYTHTDAEAGTRYYYRIIAINRHGDSAPSQVVSTTVAARRPGPPRNLTASAAGTTVTLNWNAPAEDGGSPITGYQIKRDGGQGWETLVANSGTTETTYLHTDQQRGARLRYRVSAINAVGTGPESGVAEAVVAASVPSPPTGVTANAQDESTVTIEWAPPQSDGGSPITSYQIEFSTDGATWRVLEASVAPTSRSYAHSGLDPATTYYYRVYARNRVGLSSPSDVADTATEADVPNPPTGLAAATAGSDRIDLQWRPPEYTGGVPITGYRVEYSKDAIAWRTAADHIEIEFYQHTGLEPNTVYYYRVFAVNRVGRSRASNIANASPDADVPGPPPNLGAIGVSRSEILLGWSPPENDGGSPVEGYRIEVSLDEGASWRPVREHTGTTTTAFRHRELESGTLYRYRVSAINRIGAGPPSVIAEARTHGVPDPPTSLLADAVSPTQINLWWAPPGYSGGIPVTGYVVEGSSDRGGTWEVLDRTTSATRTYAHTGLRSGTVYVYRVSAINGIGVGRPSETQQARTHSDVPEAPRGLTARAEGPRRIDLRWREPVHDGGEPVTGYQIEVSTDSGMSWAVLEGSAPATTTYTHAGLEPVTPYRYRVSALNEVGASTASNTAEATTPAEVPGPPPNLGAIGVSRSEILLSWVTPESDGGAPIVGYRIEVSLDEGASWRRVREHTGTTTTAFRHRELESGTLYRYRVSAINRIGAGPPSVIAEARTHGVPDPPTSLFADAVSPTQINLWWAPPGYSGGIPVTGYVVEGSSDRGGTWEVLDRTTSATRTYAHTGLRSGTVYVYRVSAINGIGVGRPSETQQARTHSDVPEAPRGLTARAEGPRRIDLRWREPVHDGGEPVTGYQIEVSTDSGMSWAVLEGSAPATTTYTHADLEPVTPYRYRVSALNEVGASTASNIAEATTAAEVPGRPLDLNAEALGASQVNLSWVTPESDGGAPIVGYRIEVSQDDGNSWQLATANSGTSRTEYEHAGLEPATTYRYRVAAINEAGRGAWSLEAEARTAAVAPDPPQDLEATAVAHDRISLAWRPPEYDGGAPVTAYVVEATNDEREWEVLAELAPVLAYSHMDPARGPAWHYRVRAVNEAGASEPSNVASAVIDDPVQRTDRVSEAILPWFMATATSSAVRAISDRIDAVARGDLSMARVNMQGARNGLDGLADGTTLSQGSGVLSVWGTADLTSLSNGGTVDFDGQVFSVHAGLDGLLRRDVLIGVAGNRSAGTFDFTDRSHDRSITGEYAANVTSMGPYVAWVREDVALWAASGFGWGSITMSDSLVSERTSRSASSMLAVGGTKKLGASPIGTFGLQAEGWTSELDVAGNLPSHLERGYDPGHINEAGFTVRRARLMLNWSVLDRAYGSNRTEIVLRGGGRADWNNVETGVAGTELGGGVRFESPLFRVRGSGRMFVHPAYREWGLRGMIELRSRDAYGLSLQLNPSYGATDDGIRRLWNNGAGATAGPAPPEGRLNVIAGYRPPGVPFTSFGRFDSATNQIVFGTRIQSAVDWLVEGRYTEKGPGLVVKGKWMLQKGSPRGW